MLSLVLALALSALLALVVGITWHDWKPAERRDFEPIGAALIGGIPSAIFFLAIGVKAATAEYGAGMIRLTLTATPRRGRVLAAKALVVAGLTLVAGLVLNVAMVAVAQATFGFYGIESREPRRWRRAARGAGRRRALAAVPGDRARARLRAAQHGGGDDRRPRPDLRAAVPRRRAAAVVDQHVLALAPGPASDAVAVGHLEGVTTPLSAGVGLLLVLAWTAVFLGGAWALLERRDA